MISYEDRLQAVEPSDPACRDWRGYKKRGLWRSNRQKGFFLLSAAMPVT